MSQELYTEEEGTKVCTWIVEGKSLKSYCKQEGTPNISTVYRWIIKHADFRDTYAQARKDQADTLADEIIDIADNSGNDKKTIDGVEVVNHENIQRDRLRVDARKWTASKLKPKKYSDKIDLTTKGKEIQPVDLRSLVKDFMTDEGDEEAAPGV